jgi:hypothetical protein
MAFENQAKLYCWQIARSTFHSVFVMPNGAIRIKIPPFDSNCTNYGCQMYSITIKDSILAIYGLCLWKPSEIVLCLWCYSECVSTPGKLDKYPGIFFKLSRCGYTLRVTSQTSYSPEYTIEIVLYWIDKSLKIIKLIIKKCSTFDPWY